MPRGSHTPRMDYPPLKMVQFSAESYAGGIAIRDSGGVTLRVYSAAKTVVDCVKHRNTVGLDVALEALRDARSSGQASMDELWRMAKNLQGRQCHAPLSGSHPMHPNRSASVRARLLNLA